MSILEEREFLERAREGLKTPLGTLSRGGTLFSKNRYVQLVAPDVPTDEPTLPYGSWQKAEIKCLTKQ